MKKIYLLLLAVGLFTIPMGTKAQEVFYKNENGIEMTKEQYDQLVESFPSDIIKVMTEEQFHTEIENQYKVYKTEIRHFRTDYKRDINGNIIGSFTTEISEYDYENEVPAPFSSTYASCSVNCKVHETEYKILELKLSAGNSLNAPVRVQVINTWKKIPSVKQYDIIGFRVDSSWPSNASWIENEYYAHQIWDGNVWSYSMNDSNMIKSSNGGIAEIMNIADDVKNSLMNEMSIYIKTDPYDVTIYASYQHCTSNDISKSQAMSAEITNATKSGYSILGNVFRYKNSIAEKYDQTAGVSVVFDFDAALSGQ